jgi:hypothetical protein
VIVETIRPILAEHDLAIMQGASSDDGKVLTVETMLVHKSGEWMASDVVVPMAKIDPQGAGGALTYGRRYGLSALLNIVSDEDDDGNQASRPIPVVFHLRPRSLPLQPQRKKHDGAEHHSLPDGHVPAMR